MNNIIKWSLEKNNRYFDTGAFSTQLVLAHCPLIVLVINLFGILLVYQVF